MAREVVEFSGYEWTVRSSEKSGPGPNRWEANNIRLDEKKFLHMNIKQDSRGWSCCEVWMEKRLHYGLYEFQIIGPIGRLDPGIVLGLFNYPTREIGPDTTNEIDIEFARWGNAKYPNGNFTLWPAKQGEKSISHTFAVPPDADRTTHRFLWLPDRILWQSLHGHTRDLKDNRGEFARWELKPPANSGLIPEKPLPLHLNLWLFQGKPPADSKDVEIIVTRFTHQPEGQK